MVAEFMLVELPVAPVLVEFMWLLLSLVCDARGLLALPVAPWLLLCWAVHG